LDGRRRIDLQHRTAMRALLLLPIVVMLAACAGPFAGDGAGDVVLANRTDHPLLFVALDLGLGPVVDPMPQMDPTQHPERLVEAGAQRTIDVPHYTGEGVLLFLYESPAQDHAGPWPLTRVVQVKEEELLRMHNRIVIDEE
jgi:hypothetical protein